MNSPDPDRARVVDRADLLPEETSPGSDDPEAQAEAILEESDHRVLHPEADAEDSKQTIPVMTADESQRG